MIFFILFVLLVIGFTSKYAWMQIAGKSLFAGLLTTVISTATLFGVCEAKKLPWSFCGDFTGFLNILLTATLIGIAMAIIAGVLLWRRK